MKKRGKPLSDEGMERLWLLNKHLREAKAWARDGFCASATERNLGERLYILGTTK
jgi:hypothetical protein